MGASRVSLCIASYRRPAGLARLLDSVARLKRPEAVELEVIVVDNDPAGQLVEAPPVAELPEAELHWLHEPRRNIAHARNRAVDAARGEWLGFVDDDEVLCEDWLAAYWRCAAEGAADAWFGPVLPRLEAPGPAWLDLQRFYARPRHATGAVLLAGEARTSNAFVRRSLLGSLRFDPAYGRSGGSDTLLFGRLAAAGARYAWCDAAPVWEWLPPERHRLAWLLQRSFRGGCVHQRVERELGRARAASWLRAPGVAALCLLAALAALPAGRRRAAPFLMRAAVQAGRIWTELGGRYEEYRD